MFCGYFAKHSVVMNVTMVLTNSFTCWGQTSTGATYRQMTHNPILAPVQKWGCFLSQFNNSSRLVIDRLTESANSSGGWVSCEAE